MLFHFWITKQLRVETVASSLFTLWVVFVSAKDWADNFEPRKLLNIVNSSKNHYMIEYLFRKCWCNMDPLLFLSGRYFLVRTIGNLSCFKPLETFKFWGHSQECFTTYFRLCAQGYPWWHTENIYDARDWTGANDMQIKCLTPLLSQWKYLILSTHIILKHCHWKD